MNLLVKSAIRITVVLAAIQALSSLLGSVSSTINSLRDGGSAIELLIILAVAMVIAVILWLIWTNAARITRRVVGRVDTNTLNINSSSIDAFRVGINLIGIGTFVVHYTQKAVIHQFVIFL